MIDRIFFELGPWNWMVLGFVLLVMELITPGAFMLWIGIAALIIGALSLAIWDAAIWTWQVQVLAFLVLSAWRRSPSRSRTAAAASSWATRCGGFPVRTCRPARRCASPARPIRIWS